MDALSLTNAETSFTFNNKEYKVKRANLQQVIQFQRKAKEIGDEKDAAGDLRMLSYALSLSLGESEEYILQNCPGDVDVIGTLVHLGFMNQQKAEMMSKLRSALETKG